MLMMPEANEANEANEAPVTSGTSSFRLPVHAEDGLARVKEAEQLVPV